LPEAASRDPRGVSLEWFNAMRGTTGEMVWKHSSQRNGLSASATPRSRDSGSVKDDFGQPEQGQR